jgi:hypothetical protein
MAKKRSEPDRYEAPRIEVRTPIEAPLVGITSIQPM